MNRPGFDALKPYFEGFDLSQIRVHNGIPGYVVGEPAAYTSKNDIYFAEGFYDPNTARGISLIGHDALHSRQYQELGWGPSDSERGTWASTQAAA